MNSRPETLNPEPKTRSPQPDTRDPRPEARKPETYARMQAGVWRVCYIPIANNVSQVSVTFTHLSTLYHKP